MPARQREWQAWLVVAAWTAVIYLTVPFAIKIRKFALEHLGGTEAFLWIVMA